MRGSVTVRGRLGAVALAALAVVAVAGCGDDRSGTAGAAEIVQSDVERAPADSGAGAGSAAAVQAFATDLYAILAREADEGDGNIVLSPYSVALALAMTRAGADGETAEEMDAVLHAVLAGDLHGGFNAIEQALAGRSGEFPAGPEGNETIELILATANQLWGQQGFAFEDDFLDLLAAQYGAGMRLVDFAEATEEAREAINGWVAERTRERIPELFPEGILTPNTRLVLTNAVYLKAPWAHPFDPDRTAPGPFTRIDGSEVEVELMHLSTRTRYGAGEGYEAVELPYRDGSLAMVVIVPDDLSSFEAALDGARLDVVLGSLDDAMVDLAFPRFQFRTQALLNDALEELGMRLAFGGGADFSRMTPGGGLAIQAVVHEAFIAVDEEGTEAAAATGVAMDESAATLSVDLAVDRPFLFLVRDRDTGALLFMGRVLDPTVE